MGRENQRSPELIIPNQNDQTIKLSTLFVWFKVTYKTKKIKIIIIIIIIIIINHYVKLYILKLLSLIIDFSKLQSSKKKRAKKNLTQK